MLVVAAAVLIAGCGRVGTGSGPSPTPSASSNPMSFDVTVTETTSAASIRVGQKLEVVLHAGSGMNNWTQPRSSNCTARVLDGSVDLECRHAERREGQMFDEVADPVIDE